jgi:hypothetical protein
MKIFKTCLSVGLFAGALMLATFSVAQNGTSNDQGAMAPNQSMNSAQQSAAQGEPMQLVDPAKIYNENPMSWVGKSVVLKNVTVQDTNNTGNFWIGSDNDHRLLVVKQKGNANLKAMTLHKGDVVTLTGTVQAASRYMAEDSSASSGSMHDAQNSSGVFLLANDVNVDSSTHR